MQSQRCNVTGAPPPSYPPCTLVPRRRVSIMPQIPTIFSDNRVRKSLLIPAGAPPPWTAVPPLPSKPTTLCGPKPQIPVFFSLNSVRKSLLSPAGAPPPELRRRGRRCRPYRQSPRRCVGQTHTSPSWSGGDCLKLPDFAFAENSPPPKDTNEHLAIWLQ